MKIPVPSHEWVEFETQLGYHPEKDITAISFFLVIPQMTWKNKFEKEFGEPVMLQRYLESKVRKEIERLLDE